MSGFTKKGYATLVGMHHCGTEVGGGGGVLNMELDLREESKSAAKSYKRWNEEKNNYTVALCVSCRLIKSIDSSKATGFMSPSISSDMMCPCKRRET